MYIKILIVSINKKSYTLLIKIYKKKLDYKCIIIIIVKLKNITIVKVFNCDGNFRVYLICIFIFCFIF